jgi:ceramide glucosyltransferase
LLFIFYFFAAVLILLSLHSLRGGFEYLRFFRLKLSEEPGGPAPFATVVAPCKGNDQGLKENLRALFLQDQIAYEIVFAVDDENDPAVKVIRSVMAENSRISAKLVMAPKAVRTSQKIENLIAAIKHASPASQTFVFVDSDARPRKDWLRSLVAPLADLQIGAATGYRWFIAEGPSLATEIRASWNASIASALGPNTKSNFCWGGSMAIRRDTFEKLNIAEAWSVALSDDFAVTNALKMAGLKIEFVPAALTPSVENCTFREMLEFTTRQMKITRVYSPHLWLLSWFGSGLFCSVMITAAVIVAAWPPPSLAFVIATLTLLAVSACSIGKAHLRSKAAELVLIEHHDEMKAQRKWQLALWLLTPAVFFYNCVAAASSRRLTWRGITYELKSPTETVIIAD